MPLGQKKKSIFILSRLVLHLSCVLAIRGSFIFVILSCVTLIENDEPTGGKTEIIQISLNLPRGAFSELKSVLSNFVLV